MHVAGISAATIDRALKLLPEQSKRDLASAPPKPARIRAFGDIDVAEDAVQDAFAVALRKWSRDRLPPTSRLDHDARPLAIDRLRRESRTRELVNDIAVSTCPI